jgi:hypothetical protein
MQILQNNMTSISYKCDCGTIGRCFFRPMKESANIILELQCPMCNDRESITLTTNTQNEDVSWALILKNEIE